ncbi:MAG: FAD-dependent oxidoreductase [Vampirovibrionales bacterium]|nr:FAD-dependent oxidoreductase [Vampirovibrionales bacterium]
MASTAQRILIVGGVAGGVSAAARLRRLNEDAEIIIFERGPHVSFANCGLPYYLGREIQEHGALTLESPQTLAEKLNLDVRIHHEVKSIDRQRREIEVWDSHNHVATRESYDALILAMGAAPIRPPIPGIDRPGHFTLRNIADMDVIEAWIREERPETAVIVGGGFIGLELAEQLDQRGIRVTVIEALDQVMAPLDLEMATLLHEELDRNEIALSLGDPVTAFVDPSLPDERGKASTVLLKSGERVAADLVVIGIGVRPETSLAREAGLELGDLGGIRVNERMQTSDPSIWAVGDVIEVKNPVTGQWSLVPLGGPANRQGRIAADTIVGRQSVYRGTLGTAILRLFSLTAGCTGVNEKTLQRLHVDYRAVHLHPNHHAGYYPNASRMAMKILFSPGDGRLLGAQIVGAAGVDKRIDVFATALQAGMTVHDLAALELSYAPPFGSAKDPVNLAGMIAQNILAGDVSMAHWPEALAASESSDSQKPLIMDVRDEDEFAEDSLPGAVNIPLSQVRDRLPELASHAERDIIVHCATGQRSYYACRILSQRGFRRVRNLSGALKTLNPMRVARASAAANADALPSSR